MAKFGSVEAVTAVSGDVGKLGHRRAVLTSAAAASVEETSAEAYMDAAFGLSCPREGF